MLGTFAVAAALSAHACDLCGCFTPQLEALSQPDKAELSGQPVGTTAHTRSWTSGLYGTVAEQFTEFGTVQVDGNEVDNPTDQHLDSSITQLVGGTA